MVLLGISKRTIRLLAKILLPSGTYNWASAQLFPSERDNVHFLKLCVYIYFSLRLWNVG